jgi:HlyD family secretion protein
MNSTRKRNSPLHRLLRLMKWLIPLGIIAALVALAMKPKPLEVDVGEVTEGAMQLTIDDDGETRVRDRYRIAAPLSGKLLRIDLDPGDTLQKGDVLATVVPAAPSLIDPRARAQAEAAVNAAEAGITSAETQVEAREDEFYQLEKSWRRSQILHEKGNIADAEFEQAENAHLAGRHALESAKISVDIARFELAQAKTALLHFDGKDSADDERTFLIDAPIDGTVLRIDEKSSRMVQAGEALLELGDPGELEMRIDVLSQDAVRIRSGQKVIVEHWGGENALSGLVRHVEPSAYTKVSALGVDEQRVDVIADFDSFPGEGSSLADGYRIEARIVVWESDKVIRVPVGALFRDGDDWAVYRIDRQSARLAKLELGRNNGEVAEVISGLAPGDRVVLHPGDRITEGTLIVPRK